MSDEIHNTQPPPAQKPPDHWIVDNFKKNVVAFSFAAIWAFHTFVWNAQSSQKDLKYEVDANAKAIERLIVADKEKTETMNNFLIISTKISEAQTRLASDVRDMQEQQRKNTEMIFNRK